MPISSLSFVRVTILSILIGLAALLAIVAVNLWLVRQAAVYSATVALATGERAAIVELRNTLDEICAINTELMRRHEDLG